MTATLEERCVCENGREETISSLLLLLDRRDRRDRRDRLLVLA